MEKYITSATREHPRPSRSKLLTAQRRPKTYFFTSSWAAQGHIMASGSPGMIFPPGSTGQGWSKTSTACWCLSFHPQTNGGSGKVSVLSKVVSKKDWDLHRDMFEFRTKKQKRRTNRYHTPYLMMFETEARYPSEIWEDKISFICGKRMFTWTTTGMDVLSTDWQ